MLARVAFLISEKGSGYSSVQPLNPDIMNPDESTSLMPEAQEARSLNWRQKCWGCLRAFVYLLLLLDIAGSIHFQIVTIRGSSIELVGIACMAVSGIDTLICLSFLIIVARSPPRLVTSFTDLIRLPRFWILVFLLLLYIGGFLLLVIPSPALQDAMYIGCLVADYMNAVVKVVLVAELNHVQLRNVAQGRSRQYWLLKGILGVICFNLISSMIGVIGVFYRSLSNVPDENNSRGHQGDTLTLTMNVMQVLALPFIVKITELIWTKLLQDNKCIIGKYNRNSFTRQNSRISYAIEII